MGPGEPSSRTVGAGAHGASHPDIGAGRGVRHRDPRRLAAARLAARPEHRCARLVGRRLSDRRRVVRRCWRRAARSRTCCRSRSPTRCCCVGYGFLLAGTRAFGGRETPVTVFLIAPLIWLTAMQVPAIANDINLRVVDRLGDAVHPGRADGLRALARARRAAAVALAGDHPARSPMRSMLNARMVTVHAHADRDASRLLPQPGIRPDGVRHGALHHHLRVPAAVDDQGAHRDCATRPPR